MKKLYIVIFLCIQNDITIYFFLFSWLHKTGFKNCSYEIQFASILLFYWIQLLSERNWNTRNLSECSPFTVSTDVADKITWNYRGLYSRIVYHATFGFITLYVVASRLSIYQNTIPVAFRARMAVRNNRKLRSAANKWSFAKETEKSQWKAASDAPAFPSYCPTTCEKCALIFRNNADERRILLIAARLKRPWDILAASEVISQPFMDTMNNI